MQSAYNHKTQNGEKTMKEVLVLDVGREPKGIIIPGTENSIHTMD